MPVAWLAGDLRTGRVTTRLPLVDGTWSETLDAAGALSGTLHLADPTVAALRPRVVAEVARTYLAAVWVDPTTGDDAEVIAAGPIWAHDYDDATRTLRIGAAGLASCYDRRKVLPVLTAGQSAADVTSVTSGVSLGTIAKRLVALAHTHTNGSLPVVLPPDIAGPHSRTYPGYELAWIGEQIRALTQTEGGPEVAFTPRWSVTDSRAIEWVMRTGTDTDPLLTQTAADWVLDHSVPGGRISSISVQVDGTRIGTRAWVAGAGSGESRLIGRADDPLLTAAGYPLLEVEEGRDSVEDQALLDGYAAELAVRSRSAPESWTVAVRPGLHPHPGQIRAGDWTTVIIGSHPYLDAGEQRGRLTQISGDGTGAMTLSFQREV